MLSMEIAVQIYNNTFNNKHKMVLHVRDSGGNPLQAAYAADELIKEKQIQAIIGMDTWKEAELVTEIATRAQVPILSFSAPSISPPLAMVKWPLLVRMANNDSLQMQCVASIVGSYGWRRVIAIYEDGGYNTDSGRHTLLSDNLQAVGSVIEHWLAFPPLSTLSDPKAYIQEELLKLSSSKQSRVFIIVGSSLELATHILTGAKHIGLMGRDSVWITTDSVASQLDTLNSSVLSSMQGIPGKTQFEMFVKVNDVDKVRNGEEEPTGFCIDVFKKALPLLNYALPHKFEPLNFDVHVPFNASRHYYSLVDQLYLKKFDAIVGDITILEDRSNYVEFTQPYAETEESLQSNFTRIAMVVWLFVVFVVTSSYKAGLTSMLTVQHLEPTVTDINTLNRTNSPVGCDADSFVITYLEKVLRYNPNNIKRVANGYDYPAAFESGSIKAAFMEVPYKRAFLSKYCKDYQIAGPTYRFGGLGFAFPKGSPMARDFSDAFLKLSEDGTLNALDNTWFKPSDECSNLDSAADNQSLSLHNFRSLFLFSVITSTIIVMIVYIASPLRTTTSQLDNNFWNVIKILGTYFSKGNRSSDMDRLSAYNSPGHHPRRPLRIAYSFPALYTPVHLNEQRIPHSAPNWPLQHPA
ncbi:Glutamate receptor [Thalictrum thalictroides]|uniref:Glutamate receptor n=1 Tax=Thalictrum thalictroides TaxID=46969 RepID=A0A7J6WZY8_THATH|nr:Glutamate receptor [Thalictrum thalictroides]